MNALDIGLKQFGPLQPGTTVMAGGISGCGKTLFLGYVAEKANEQGLRVAFIDTEGIGHINSWLVQARQKSKPGEFVLARFDRQYRKQEADAMVDYLIPNADVLIVDNLPLLYMRAADRNLPHQPIGEWALMAKSIGSQMRKRGKVALITYAMNRSLTPALQDPRRSECDPVGWRGIQVYAQVRAKNDETKTVDVLLVRSDRARGE